MSWTLDSMDYVIDAEARVRIKTPPDERERIVEEMAIEAGARMLLTRRIIRSMREREAARRAEKS